VVDAWSLTDNRPEATVDGVHWIPEYHKDERHSRPLSREAAGISIYLFC
jgi:hypothetical protein